MPPKGSKANNKKQKQLGQIARNKKIISTMELTRLDQIEVINKLEHSIERKKERIDSLTNESNNLSDPTINLNNKRVIPLISEKAAKQRLKNPTTDVISLKAKQRRRNETFNACSTIHGASKENNNPTLDGIVDTVSAKFKSDELACKLLSSKPSVVNALTHRVTSRFRNDYYKSEKNILRSLNIYYSYNVMGKRKYLNIRKSHKSPDIPNFVPYKQLSQRIRDIDIGQVNDINPVLTLDLPEDELGEGMFRNLVQFSLRLAEFYIKVNMNRTDKLKNFEQIKKKNLTSILFLMAIGGDEAPITGTSFLLSFLNVGKRLASSFENYLVFGGNVKENGSIVRRYVLKLMTEIKHLESEVFTLNIQGTTHLVEFKLEALPNDMKMLAFLAGELSNAAYYFTTFANITKDGANDVSKSKFGKEDNANWKPFVYEQRISDAKEVKKKKLELSKKNIKPVTMRSNLTSFISKQLKSRQEEEPLVGAFVDLAKCEPLHLKNNTVKERFVKILKIVISQANLPAEVKCFKDLPDDNLFVHFIKFIRVEMNSNYLAKKIIAWFNENKVSKQQREFGFRFRGRESYNYLQGFPSLIYMLKSLVDKNSYLHLLQVFYESVCLRKLISYSVRIEDTDDLDVDDMITTGRHLFTACALYDGSVSPSLWCFALVAPVHCKELLSKLNLGLGSNTMEGREQKHQQIGKYAHNTTVQQRWSYIFRHEFIQLIYLREQGFDTLRYRKRNTKYIPELLEGHCKCSLALFNSNCIICDSPEMHGVVASVEQPHS